MCVREIFNALIMTDQRSNKWPELLDLRIKMSEPNFYMQRYHMMSQLCEGKVLCPYRTDSGGDPGKDVEMVLRYLEIKSNRVVL